jgi:hypothetical protein
MSNRIRTSDYREELRPGRYPFRDDASLLDSGGVAIPDDLILDASLFPIGSYDNLQITKIAITPQSATISIGQANALAVLTATIDTADPPEVLNLTDSRGRAGGVLVLDTSRALELQTWATGDHAFAFGAAAFVASCIIPTPEVGIRGFLTDDGVLHTGDVWLVGADGVVLRQVDDGVIRVDVVGDPLFKRRLCRPLELFQAPRFLQTINGIGPDEYGILNLLVVDAQKGDTILRITPSGESSLTIAAVGRPLSGA